MKLFSLMAEGDVHLASGQKIIPAAEFSTLHDAHEVLLAAKREAQEIKRAAEQEAETIKERSLEKGFQEGLQSFNAHIAALDQELKKLREEIHDKILPLALSAARKLLGEELKLHPDRIVEIVMTALKPITSHRKIILYVNREDLATLEANKPKIKKLFEHLDSFSVQERSDIEPGGCIIETEAGIINAQLENQWRALESAFHSFMKK